MGAVGAAHSAAVLTSYGVALSLPVACSVTVSRSGVGSLVIGGRKSRALVTSRIPRRVYVFSVSFESERRASDCVALTFVPAKERCPRWRPMGRTVRNRIGVVQSHHATTLPNPPDRQVDRARAVRARAGGVGGEHGQVGRMVSDRRHVDIRKLAAIWVLSFREVPGELVSEAIAGLFYLALLQGPARRSHSDPPSGAYSAQVPPTLQRHKHSTLDRYCRDSSLDSVRPIGRSGGPSVVAGS